MENVAVSYVEQLGGFGPLYLFVIGILIIVSYLVIKYMPIWHSLKDKQLEIEAAREKRKVDEAKARAQYEAEHSAIAQRQVEAQDRSTAAMNAMTQQMAVLEARLESAQHNSRVTDEKIDDMATEVHDIHTVIIPYGKRGDERKCGARTE